MVCGTGSPKNDAIVCSQQASCIQRNESFIQRPSETQRWWENVKYSTTRNLQVQSCFYTSLSPSISSAFTESWRICTRKLTMTEERPELQLGETRSNETSNNRNEGWATDCGREARSHRKGCERRCEGGTGATKTGDVGRGQKQGETPGATETATATWREMFRQKGGEASNNKKGGARDQQPTGGGEGSNQRGEETRSNEEGNLFRRSQIEVHMNMCGIVCVGFLPKDLFILCI